MENIAQKLDKNLQKMPLKTRFAPTPSGFLHLGNVFSFLLTWLLARRESGKIYLRIDDIDASRSRPEYVEDIFFTLDWLGLDYDEGAQNVDDFYKFYSQQHRLEHYDSFLSRLAQQWLFPCTCSRREIIEKYQGIYNGNCLSSLLSEKTHFFQKENEIFIQKENQKCAWRLQTQKLIAQTYAYFEYDWKGREDKKVQFKGDLVHREMPYYILRSKQNRAAYQLVSLIEDLENQINFIVRGSDLIPSTQAQMALASLLSDFFSFKNTIFLHHRLMHDLKGDKLSKSAGAAAIYHQRARGEVGKSFVFESFSEFLGLKEKLYSLKDFQLFFEAQS
ncbi:glutamate--tRNA ligase family protein [Hugenholtzia roseola]|uniref:glutamate--tRNA ligase family protein n=1 Tax=Hugenholtzia roseola TaxID=1002 RepID=UPI0004069F97|nr:glutamate--tRNA ligase family protein [Hugenholtzia roseola]